MRRAPYVPTRAERWTTPDDDEIEIRRLDAPSGSGPETPRLVLLHGLEGTIRSHYLRGILFQARLRGWAADVLVFRGCNGEPNRARRMYHSGETTDLDFVVRRLVDEKPEQPLVMAGVSLGGNVLLKWLGERGTGVPSQLRGAGAISVPYDLERSARRMEQGFSRIYTMHFLWSLQAKARAKLERFPGLFDSVAMERARTLFEFDDAVTAPVHGFTDAHDYYRRSSSLQYLTQIRIPTLLLGSYDDPFLPPEVLDDVLMVARNNRNIVAELHYRGGHVGFVSGLYPFDTHFYAEERVIEFLVHQINQDLRFNIDSVPSMATVRS